MITEKGVTVKDIAQTLNISLSTVNKALTGKPGISDARRKEVQKVARDMGYVVNNVAQSLARNTLIIGVIIPSAWENYFDKVKEGMNAAFNRLVEYKVKSEFFYISSVSQEADGKAVHKWIKAKELDAVIFCPSIYTLNGFVLKAIEDSKIPMFLAGGGIGSDGAVSMISLDAELSGKIAADFFYCIYGKNICAAFFTSSSSIVSHKAKVDAFVSRVEEKGGRVDAIYETDDDLITAYQCTQKLCEEHPEVNCIYVGSAIAESVCRYISDNELENRYTILGSDIYEAVKEYMRRGVIKATVLQYPEKLGETAVETAYKYLVKSHSYTIDDWAPQKEIMITPSILFQANVE